MEQQLTIARTLFKLLVLPILCVVSSAQDSSYYKAIQKSSSAPVQPAKFRQMEENALKDYSKPESYDILATSFGDTTEKVWAVIYGEIYCNLSPDADRASQMGSLVYLWYEESLSKKGDNLSVNLTEHAQTARNQVPFESQFEMSFLLGAAGLKDPVPLTIQKLTAIRKNQLALWEQKKLPRTELVRRQEAILSAGHFDAYNFWQFKSARPDEYNDWLKEHQVQFQAWLEWQGKNKFSVQVPDFQRLRLLRGL